MKLIFLYYIVGVLLATRLSTLDLESDLELPAAAKSESELQKIYDSQQARLDSLAKEAQEVAAKIDKAEKALKTASGTQVKQYQEEIAKAKLKLGEITQQLTALNKEVDETQKLKVVDEKNKKPEVKASKSEGEELKTCEEMKKAVKDYKEKIKAIKVQLRKGKCGKTKAEKAKKEAESVKAATEAKQKEKAEKKKLKEKVKVLIPSIENTVKQKEDLLMKQGKDKFESNKKEIEKMDKTVEQDLQALGTAQKELKQLFVKKLERVIQGLKDQIKPLKAKLARNVERIQKMKSQAQGNPAVDKKKEELAAKHEMLTKKLAELRERLSHAMKQLDSYQNDAQRENVAGMLIQKLRDAKNMNIKYTAESKKAIEQNKTKLLSKLKEKVAQKEGEIQALRNKLQKDVSGVGKQGIDEKRLMKEHLKKLEYDLAKKKHRIASLDSMLISNNINVKELIAKRDAVKKILDHTKDLIDKETQNYLKVKQTMGNKTMEEFKKEQAAALQAVQANKALIKGKKQEKQKLLAVLEAAKAKVLTAGTVYSATVIAVQKKPVEEKEAKKIHKEIKKKQKQALHKKVQTEDNELSKARKEFAKLSALKIKIKEMLEMNPTCPDIKKAYAIVKVKLAEVAKKLGEKMNHYNQAKNELELHHASNKAKKSEKQIAVAKTENKLKSTKDIDARIEALAKRRAEIEAQLNQSGDELQKLTSQYSSETERLKELQKQGAVNSQKLEKTNKQVAEANKKK